MDILLLILPFILGCLVGVLYVEIHGARRLEKQRENERDYEALLWKQLGQCQELLQLNKGLLTDNRDLKKQYLDLQQTHQKMLAVLN